MASTLVHLRKWSGSKILLQVCYLFIWEGQVLKLIWFVDIKLGKYTSKSILYKYILSTFPKLLTFLQRKRFGSKLRITYFFMKF